MTMPANAHLLMCRPQHFAVSYAINPWMDPESWARDQRAHRAAVRQWDGLHGKLKELGATIELVPPVPGLPDLVFTANAAVVLDRQVLLARFRHPERQREESHFEAAFRALQAHGLVDTVRKLPDGLVLEGAGDCVWDDTRKLFWLGYGPRSDAAASSWATTFPKRSTSSTRIGCPAPTSRSGSARARSWSASASSVPATC